MSDFIETALSRFDLCVSAESENRERAIQALHFRYGDQWPDEIKKVRKNKPMLVLNRIPAIVRQIINDIRQVRPHIKVHPVDDAADVKTAEYLNGIIRSIEANCNAEAAYDWGAEYAATAGWGYWTINTRYLDGDTFDQEIVIRRKNNPFTVYLDPHREEPDGSDMRYAFEITDMPKSEFESRFPKAKSEWSTEAQGSHTNHWFKSDSVRVAKYWYVQKSEYVISQMADDEILQGDIEGAVRKRTVTEQHVKHALITGLEVLEQGDWAGRYIPIVECVGNELNIEGKTCKDGAVKDLIDPQRQYNYIRSADTERVALAPKAPYIGPKGAFKNPKWRNANNENYPYLEYEAKDTNGEPIMPPSRETPVDISPGMANLSITAANEIKEISGIRDPNLGQANQERSGRAIRAVQSEGDVSNFHFVDNLARSIRYTGRILVDLIPKIYDAARVVQILEPNGETTRLKINQEFLDEKTQKIQEIRLDAGRFDVTVDVGPGYATQRQEASESMINLIQAMPEAAPLIGDILAKNFDWPEADEVAKRLRTLLPVDIVDEENPQVKAVIMQLQQKVQQTEQVAAAYMQAAQQLEQQLMDKNRELEIKAAEVERKSEKDDQDLLLGLGELEVKASKDIPGSPVP